ncbi:type I pullulanase [Metabacillus arenae]|uniref:Type I pullulanase n=1 Tax=Metabacillus arenae TaxID=2771434 RepID=A0A926NHN0_9BACI|nr:type I pullulanase [Metabacillus arenae]MBD1380183.1 type I pullulanase [Metabacillus arenae]
MLKIRRPFDAYLDEFNLITILIPKQNHHSYHQKFYLFKEKEKIVLNIIEHLIIDKYVKYICRFNEDIGFGKTYYIEDVTGMKTDLQIGAVIRTALFDESFYYAGDLGVDYSSKRTKLTLWAPTATEVKVKLFSPHTGMEEIQPLHRQERGVWSATLAGDYEHYYYSYLICINLKWREAVDPYATAVSLNGELGVIIDIGKTETERVITSELQKPTDAIIYELHIRDFSIHPDSGMAYKGKYLAFTELESTTHHSFSTGLSYIKDLGVTHIELLPFNDFEGVDETRPDVNYNWGYNPLHFNAPEGSYSTSPSDPYKRIFELKEAINAIHKQGLKVIMDAVYNHVFIREQSSFEKIVPGYYFRHDTIGLPSNGTGVGNDIASERLMVRKFIIDSVKYWMRNFDVDGFRFDLMGILDVETMNQVRHEVDKFKKDALVFGEGWDLQTPLPYQQKATIANSKKMPGIAFFNDMFRDNIKGSTFEPYDRGFALGNHHKTHEAKQSIVGSIPFNHELKGMFQEPSQTINYVESHDNHTFWDKMNIPLKHEADTVKRKWQRLAASMVILSQGIPFLHAGQEFFRTKQGIENSYRSPDHINQLDWHRREKYNEDVEYVKKLISFRKSHPALRLPKTELVKKHLAFLIAQDGIISYLLHSLEGIDTYKQILVVHNNRLRDPFPINLPDQEEWILKAAPASFTKEEIRVSGKIIIDDIGTNILFKI